MLELILKSDKPPEGGGWENIPRGKHGGKRRKTGSGYEYWYPKETSASQAPTKKDSQKRGTLGAHEDDVNRLLYMVLQNYERTAKHRKNPENKGFVVFPMQRPDGLKANIQLTLNVTSKTKKKKPHGQALFVKGAPKEIVLLVPHDPKNNTNILDNKTEGLKALRKILSHELTHIFDINTPTEKQDYEIVRERGKRGEPGVTHELFWQTYYNNKREFLAFRENIFRELNTPEVKKQVEEEVEGSKNKTISQKTMDAIASEHSYFFKRVVPYLNAENKKKIYKMVATLLYAHAYDVSKPFEKSLNPFSILLRN